MKKPKPISWDGFEPLPLEEATRWQQKLRSTLLRLHQPVATGRERWACKDDPWSWGYAWERLIGRTDLNTDRKLKDFLVEEAPCIMLGEHREPAAFHVPLDFVPGRRRLHMVSDTYWVSLNPPHRCYVLPHEFMDFGCWEIELGEALS